MDVADGLVPTAAELIMNDNGVVTFAGLDADNCPGDRTADSGHPFGMPRGVGLAAWLLPGCLAVWLPGCGLAALLPGCLPVACLVACLALCLAAVWLWPACGLWPAWPRAWLPGCGLAALPGPCLAACWTEITPGR